MIANCVANFVCAAAMAGSITWAVQQPLNAAWSQARPAIQQAATVVATVQQARWYSAGRAVQYIASGGGGGGGGAQLGGGRP